MADSTLFDPMKKLLERKSEQEDSQSWKMTFADLLGNMLCFFMLHYVLLQMSGQEQKMALSNMRAFFGVQTMSQTSIIPPLTRLQDKKTDTHGGSAYQYALSLFDSRLEETKELAGFKLTVGEQRSILSLPKSNIDTPTFQILVDSLNRLGQPLLILGRAQSEDPRSWAEMAEKSSLFHHRLLQSGLKVPGQFAVEQVQSGQSDLVIAIVQGE